MDEITPPQAPNSRNLVPVILSTALITALLVGCGVYVYTKNENTKTKTDLQTQINALKSQVTPVTPTPSPIAQASIASPGPIAEWKSFSSKTYGYAIKYPENWYIDSTYSESAFTARGGNNTIGGDTTFSNYPTFDYSQENIPSDLQDITLAVYKTSQSLNDFLSATNCTTTNYCTVSNQTTATIGGKNSLSYKTVTTTGLGGYVSGISYTTLIQLDGEIMVLGYSPSITGTDINSAFSSMVSSLTF